MIKITGLRLSSNALIVLKKRYLKKDFQGRITETPEQLFQRVAQNIARADLLYPQQKKQYHENPPQVSYPALMSEMPSISEHIKNARILNECGVCSDTCFERRIFRIPGTVPYPATKVAGFGTVTQYKKTQKQFYELLASLDFLPNSPALFNAGRRLQQLAACFVLPIEDDLSSIFQTLHKTALIHQSGGGTGFSFSRLRPKNDLVRSTGGKASGPLSFLRVFDAATEQIKQGGKRRGANMGVLRIDHPDIEEFILAKQRYPLTNFNLSVAVTDNFIKAVKQNKMIGLVNPRTRKTVKKVSARKLFDLIGYSAWQTGDPGVLFIDTINKKHPLKEKIEATNPCGEVPLLPYESCNLGSINLANHLKDNQIDWLKLKQTIHTAVHFLDNCIDLSNYIFPEIDQATKKNRKIGLGVMGFADLLIQLNVSYNSDQAIQIAEKLMHFIQQEAITASQNLAKLRSPFPNFPHSKLKQPQRNATLLSIAPTGTLSLIAGCSSGIEPLFALAFSRHVLDDQLLTEINKDLFFELKKRKIYTKKIIGQIKKTGTLKGIKGISPALKRLFVTALEIPPEQHLRMQAVFQKYVDNAVSKTINLPERATVNQIKMLFLMAHQLGCKGLTVYRYGSKVGQVLTFGLLKEKIECLSCETK